ncbi:unnamed protein product, partial [Brassica oleracea var. botrytis]
YSRKHGKQPTQLSWSSPWVAPGEIEAELIAILKETTPRLDMSEYTTESVRNVCSNKKQRRSMSTVITHKLSTFLDILSLQESQQRPLWCLIIRQLTNEHNV